MNEVDRAGDVGIHDVTGFVEILIKKSLAEAAAGIGEESCNRSTIDLAEELVDTLGGSKVSLHDLDGAIRRGAALRRRFRSPPHWRR